MYQWLVKFPALATKGCSVPDFFSGKPFRTFATSSNSKLEKTNWWPLDFWTMKRMILVDDVWAHSLAPVMIYQGDAPSPFMTCCYPRSIQLQDEVVGRSTKCTLGASWLVLLGGLGGSHCFKYDCTEKGFSPRIDLLYYAFLYETAFWTFNRMPVCRP